MWLSAIRDAGERLPHQVLTGAHRERVGHVAAASSMHCQASTEVIRTLSAPSGARLFGLVGLEERREFTFHLHEQCLYARVKTGRVRDCCGLTAD